MQNNGGDDLTLNADSSFTFSTSAAYGDSYAVSILTQPTGQSCTVSNGSGTVSGAVTSVVVSCRLSLWTREGGSNLADQHGVYGTLGVTDAANIPGGRYSAMSWTDGSGNLWLFGGLGVDSSGLGSYLNDLWQFDGSNWTWMSGSSVGNQSGVYGTQGVADAANMPGGRFDAVTWTDGSGNLWLFGGFSQGYYLNDLWRFDGTNWTWMSGSSVGDQAGVYGTIGVANPANVPGARYQAISWTDNSGNLWLFGGLGCDSTGSAGDLNDLWRFDGTNWTWMGGSSLKNQSGVYGTKGVANAANIPGARYVSTSWTDGSGNTWLFGGAGYDSTATQGDLNDLWRFDGSNWTWMGGSSVVNQSGVYGTFGVADAANIPGGRVTAASWTDNSGNLWLFGGVGYDSTGTRDFLNGLWKFDGSYWTWMGGSDVVNQVSEVEPGGRGLVATWTDGSGKAWLFGGNGNDSTGTQGYLNDLWSFQP